MQSQRQIDAATFQADYQDAATQADRAKRIALAQAAKTRDLDLATDDAGQSDWQYGYFSLSAAEKTYRKAIADADWAYQTAVADALRALQSADAASKATYTTAAANLDFAYETGIAGHELTYQHSVADANRTKASADADARRDYLNAEAGARSGRRTAIAASSVAQLTSDAAGVLAAYDHVDQQYSLPYTAYLRGLAQINQVVASQIATATTNLESNRNSADNLYYNQTIGASHTMELAYADAVKTHDRETATADRDAAVDDATAAKDFYVNLATPASDYARDLAAAQATHSIDVATAAKTLVHEQADEVDGASANHQAAARTADDTFAGTRTTVEQTWWTAEAGKQADLLIAQAQAERDRFVDMLTADKNQIVSQNNAQSTYRTTSAHAYHASESAWAQHEHTFRLVAINSSAAQSSGLRDPWSAQDDSLRSGRAQSDRDRAKAERDLQIARITAQRDIELNLFPAETTLRNSNTGATLLGFTSSADDVRDVATAVANAHRNAAATGNRPAQTQVYKQLGGTLNIAGQISVSMPASGWMAVTDRVLDRTLNWTSNIYDQLPDS